MYTYTYLNQVSTHEFVQMKTLEARSSAEGKKQNDIAATYFFEEAQTFNARSEPHGYTLHTC